MTPSATTVSDGSRLVMDRLIAACFSLLVAAIALAVAVSILRPYFPVLAIGGSVFVAVASWRAWQRSRW